jgi:CxxC-x17-CxxC domain-containing protein
MITRLQLAAMSRIDVPEEKRKDFYLYVDEFQNFATESFANILSEARKYRLNIILAHQYINQLEEPVRDAVFGNVGTLMSFRVGAEDAEFLEKEFAPEFAASDLVNLTKFDIYLKLMIDGMASRPFSATTLPPYSKQEKSYREKVIGLSRERYASSKEEVEKKIAEWSGFGKKTIESETIQRKRELFDAICAHCGKETKLPFKPDGRRPVYCENCLNKIKKGELSPAPRTKEINKISFQKRSDTEQKEVVLEKKGKERSRETSLEGRQKQQKEKKKDKSLIRTGKIDPIKSKQDRQALRNALQDILKNRQDN